MNESGSSLDADDQHPRADRTEHDRPPLNLGIVAHVDAGKTSLTERLLYATGAIDRLGSVDHGTTRTDSLALERERGITIKSAVTSMHLPPRAGATAWTRANLVDTPGHPDFVAEVERVLGVLDGAVLVVSAVEGVQAHTRVLLRTLRRLAVPTLIFVNKIDRRGARGEELVEELAAKLGVDPVPMSVATEVGSATAAVRAARLTDLGSRIDPVIETLLDRDEALAQAYLDDQVELDWGQVIAEIAEQTRVGVVHPVFCGSAITGAGIKELITGISELLAPAAVSSGDPLSGTVFKIERDQADRRLAYLRLFGGAVRIRDTVRIVGRGERTVTAVRRCGDPEIGASGTVLTAGEIGVVSGLGDVAIGDLVGTEPARLPSPAAFDPPFLETEVMAVDPRQTGALHQALTELAEQDPLINAAVQQTSDGTVMTLSLYGDVQREVIESTLVDDYGVAVRFTQSRTACIERLAGSGSALQLITDEDNPFLATVGLRIEPVSIGDGISFALEVELGAMPLAFFTAVEATVRAELAEGLSGWPIPDARVVMTHSGYYPRQSHSHARFDKSMSSTGSDFRLLTPLVLAAALRAARTRVCEPVHRFRLELPTDSLGPILPALTRLGAIPLRPDIAGSWCVLDGEIPAEQIQAARRLLPGLTQGEGVLQTSFERYQPVTGTPPDRPRSSPDAQRRKEYLLTVQRRVNV